MSENTDTEIVHTIFVADMLQIIALYCQDIREIVRTVDDEELRKRVADTNAAFAARVDQIRWDARDNFNEAIEARKQERERAQA